MEPLADGSAAYVTLPWSTTRAYRPVRPSAAQPILLENLVSVSLTNNFCVSHCIVSPQAPVCKKVWWWMQTHNVVVRDAVGLGPRRHDKGVVGGHDDNLVDAGLLEGLPLLEEGRQVLLGAGGREGAGDGDHDDLFVLELCIVPFKSAKKYDKGRWGIGRKDRPSLAL